jgi:hypothetical protein
MATRSPVSIIKQIPSSEVAMDNLQPATTAPSAPPRRRPLYLIGVVLFFVGPLIYYIQFRLRHLGVPWYAPVLATLGVVFLVVSVIQHGGVLRIAGLVLLTLLCGLEWFVLLVGSKTPLYTGPAAAGRPVPAFVTTLADGKPFSSKDLEKGTPTVLLFFRGRW